MDTEKETNSIRCSPKAFEILRSICEASKINMKCLFYMKTCPFCKDALDKWHANSLTNKTLLFVHTDDKELMKKHSVNKVPFIKDIISVPNPRGVTFDQNVIDRVRTAIKYPTRDCNKDNESDSDESDESDDNTSSASSAGTSNSASSADTSNSASSAGTSNSVSSAGTSNSAGTSDSASSAGTSDSASNAGTSDSASNAGTSDSASSAGTSDSSNGANSTASGDTDTGEVSHTEPIIQGIQKDSYEIIRPRYLTSYEQFHKPYQVTCCFVDENSYNDVRKTINTATLSSHSSGWKWAIAKSNSNNFIKCTKYENENYKNKTVTIENLLAWLNCDKPDALCSMICKGNLQHSITECSKLQRVVVLYYADWCGHCTHFKPEWNSAVCSCFDTHDTCWIACNENDPEVKTNISINNIEAFPTIRMFFKGDVMDMTGQFPRTKEGLISFSQSA